MKRKLSRGNDSPEGRITEPAFLPAKGAEALATAGVCVALGIVLPFFIHPFGLSPRVVLPMHFAVFLAGILLSPLHAALVGIMTPALSSGFTGMPTATQVIRMMPELAVYGAVTAIILRIMPVWPGFSKKLGRILATAAAMLIAMILGRAVYVVISILTTGLESLGYYAMILVVPAIPGIIAQLIIIPPLAYKLQQIVYRK